MGVLRTLLAVSCALAASACAPSVYYYQRSVQGIGIYASTADATGQIVVGEHRKIIPVVQSATNAPDGEAMSFLGCTETRAAEKGALNVFVTDYTATGAAADMISAQTANTVVNGCFQAREMNQQMPVQNAEGANP